MKPPVLRGKPIVPPSQISRIRFSPCGKQLAAASHDATIKRWDVTGTEPKELPSFSGHNGYVASLAFHPDKQRLFTCDTWGRLTGWNYLNGKVIWDVPTAHDGWLRAIALSPSGDTVATCGRDGFVRFWNATTGKKAGEIMLGVDLFAMAYHPEGKSLVVGDLFGNISEIALAKNTVERTIPVKAFHLLDRIQDVGGVRGLLFDAKAETLFASGAQPKSGGFVQAFPLMQAIDWKTSKPGASWKAPTDNEGFIHDVGLHPDGYLYAVTSGQPGNGSLLFWKPGEAQPLFRTNIPNCHSVDLHPDGKYLAVACTNANSSGNGRAKGKEYPSNYSPILFWNMGSNPAGARFSWSKSRFRSGVEWDWSLTRGVRLA